jgi:response regulator NasT
MPQTAAKLLPHILVVDDDALALTILSEGLGAAGYMVTTAESGEDALECAKGQNFDLAIVDMNMPGISGAALAKQLLSAYACLSLILSGRNDAESVKTAVAEGALGYLVKPIEVPKLIPSIETALARCAEMSDLARSRENLSVALREGRETSIAVGILVERLRLDRETAFARMRDGARSRRKRVSQIAAEIIQASEVLNGF